jgi:hypothetical protein
MLKESPPMTTYATLSFILFGIMILLSIIGSVYTSVQSSKPKTKLTQTIAAFSFIENFKKFFTLSESGSDPNLKVLNGVWFFSMNYVILGHVFGFSPFRPTLNVLTYEHTVMSPWWSPIIPGGFYAVDSFFLLSGFLTFALLAEKMWGKPLKVAHFLMIYVHWYLRLIFVMIFVMLFAIHMF